MAGNTQMNESERGVFSIHGVTGYLIAVVLLLSILGVLTVLSLGAQNAEATNYYSVNQDINGLKMIDSSANQYQHYKLGK
jgi:hypothetical protein